MLPIFARKFCQPNAPKAIIKWVNIMLPIFVHTSVINIDVTIQLEVMKQLAVMKGLPQEIEQLLVA